MLFRICVDGTSSPGSAYTYAYTTMGELFAWIIGWDLVLEYAVGAATVANGWSSYFQRVLAKFSIFIPEAINDSIWKYNEKQPVVSIRPIPTSIFPPSSSWPSLP